MCIKNKKKSESVVVVHTCNLSYSGGGDQKEQRLRTSEAKSYGDLILTNKPNMTGYACYPRYARGLGRRRLR
jgi:hypothetical protein